MPLGIIFADGDVRAKTGVFCIADPTIALGLPRAFARDGTIEASIGYPTTWSGSWRCFRNP